MADKESTFVTGEGLGREGACFLPPGQYCSRRIYPDFWCNRIILNTPSIQK